MQTDGWKMDDANADFRDVVISPEVYLTCFVTFDLSAGELVFRIQSGGRIFEHRIKDVTPPAPSLEPDTQYDVRFEGDPRRDRFFDE